MNSEPASSAGSPRRHGDWLGLPALAGHGSLAVSLLIDSLGDGLFVPFAIVYFLHTTRLTLPTIGLGLSAAGLLALPVVLPVGILLDRYSSATVVIGANLLSAVGYAGYLLVGRAWQLVFFTLLAGAGSRAYWTANLGLIGDGFGTDRQRWFALQRALRNSGFGLGGLLGAVAISIGTGAAYHALAAVNAASYVLAAVLVWRWSARQGASGRGRQERPDQEMRESQQSQGEEPVPHEPVPRWSIRPRRVRRGSVPAGARGRPGGYRLALRDLPFMLITPVNLRFVLCMTAPEVLLALYLIRALHEPAWLAGVLFAVNTAVVAVGQTALSRIVAHLPPVRMLRLTAVVWTAGFAGFWLAGMLPRAAVVAGLFAAVLICTAAEMIQGPAMNDLVVASAPDHARGRYLGVYQLSWGLGRAVAPAVLTGLFAVSAGLPWLVLAAGCAGCAIALRSGRLSHLARQSADAPPAPGGV